VFLTIKNSSNDEAQSEYSTTRHLNGLHKQTSLPMHCKKAKASYTRYWGLGPELIPVYRQSARRWLQVIHTMVGCHYFLPGLRLPSQPQSITTPQPVPSYTAWWWRHIGANNLPKVVTQLLPQEEFKPMNRKSNTLPIVQPHHLTLWYFLWFWWHLQLTYLLTSLLLYLDFLQTQ